YTYNITFEPTVVYYPISKIIFCIADIVRDLGVEYFCASHLQSAQSRLLDYFYTTTTPITTAFLIIVHQIQLTLYLLKYLKEICSRYCWGGYRSDGFLIILKCRSRNIF